MTTQVLCADCGVDRAVSLENPVESAIYLGWVVVTGFDTREVVTKYYCPKCARANGLKDSHDEL